MIGILSGLYVLALSGLSVFGLLGLLTLSLFWRHRHAQFPPPMIPEDSWPAVTVQLPIYNERYVVEQLIETAVSLNYPRDKIQIQVIDDSTDDTTDKAAQLVQDYQKQGINICLLHRVDRQGYKAGALAQALDTATGEFIAIFDADFQPPVNFLRQTIPHFHQQPRLGVVQARWEHLNAKQTLLTRAQAIALDKHFAMEQTVRHRANLFPKFNGAAGVWRRSCLEDAGGWLDDTVCEDLCLSTRAVLNHWQFRFLMDVEAPAELPTSITAYKSQQARWAKGSTQCLRKYGRSILHAPNQTLTARWYAILSMAAYATHLLLLLMLLVQVPLTFLNFRFPPHLILFSIAGIGQPLLFILAQQVLHKDWQQRLLYLPAILIVAIGLTPSNTRAILQAFFKIQHPFIRTQKLGANSPFTPHSYQASFDPIIFYEILLATYTSIGLGAAIWQQNYAPLFLLLTAFLGFSYVAFASIRDLYT